MPKKPHNPNVIQIRTLDGKAKEKIRSLMRYGDTAKVAKRCDWITYNQVSNVLRGVSENDEVWKIALEYLNELPSVELDDKLASIINCS